MKLFLFLIQKNCHLDILPDVLLDVLPDDFYLETPLPDVQPDDFYLETPQETTWALGLALGLATSYVYVYGSPEE